MPRFANYIVFTALVAGSLHAEPFQMRTEVPAEASNRRLLSTGFYVSMMGDPYPSLAGANIAVNMFDFLRLTFGMGGYTASVGSSSGARADSASATSYAGGVKVLMPGWSFSPVAGMNYARLQISSRGGRANVQGFRTSGDYWYGSLGLDWQSTSGFNVGAGCNVALQAAGSASPYINIGYFFPII